MGVSASCPSKAADSAAPPRTSTTARAKRSARRDTRTPRAARAKASINSTRLASMAPITAAHFAVSASESQSRSNGNVATMSTMRRRAAGRRNVAATPSAATKSTAPNIQALSLNHTPAPSTAAASHGRSWASSSRLANCGTTNTNTNNTAETPAATNIAG